MPLNIETQHAVTATKSSPQFWSSAWDLATRELRRADLKLAKILRDAVHLGLPRKLGKSDEEKIMDIASIAVDVCMEGEVFPGILRKR
jgi:hypothetical protein